ncbi:phosphotransferase [Actinomadura fibrosa]|uniref:phosphotransferase n=1 Tax=Actinomadura fibrosa TaxID=111802 RepID=UPI001041A331|nr:phosphotransferase [Actinomadura fibrosa]
MTSRPDGPSAAPEWAPEREITEEAAAALVGERFPELRGAAVERLATGWDNTVLLVAGEFAFRFPRRGIAVPGVRREIAALPLLAPRVPLPVPVPRFVGEPSPSFPWPFWGARLLPGRELADVRPPDGDRVRLGGETGAFLRALHDPALAAEAERALPPGALPVDPLRRADVPDRRPRPLERRR